MGDAETAESYPKKTHHSVRIVEEHILIVRDPDSEFLGYTSPID